MISTNSTPSIGTRQRLLSWLLALSVFLGVTPPLPAFTPQSKSELPEWVADQDGGVHWGESVDFETSGPGLGEAIDPESGNETESLDLDARLEASEDWKFGALVFYGCNSSLSNPNRPIGRSSNKLFIEHSRLNI